MGTANIAADWDGTRTVFGRFEYADSGIKLMRASLRELLRILMKYRASGKVALLSCAGLLLVSTESGRAQALAAQGAIDLKGNLIATDSYDSSAPDYPGYWTNSIRKAGGDVVTASTITNLAIGNAHIAGHVATGPGGGYTVQANGSVGDLAWVDAGTPGVEPGWFADDINVVFKDVVIPDVAWWNPGARDLGGPGVAPDGLTYAHVFTTAASGSYFTLSDSGDIYVGTNVMVTVKVVNSVGKFAPNNIFVAGAGANAGKFVAYVDCTNFAMGAGAFAQSRIPANLVLLGTSNCTSATYKGNGDFAGLIYAPSADFQLAGGGSGILDFLGGSITKTVQLNGHYHFHFDEALDHLNVPMLLFSTGPQNRAAVVGQDTSLSASALGARPLSYQWLFGGSVIPGATNSVLVLTNIQSANAGLYEAVITNISGSVTSQVQLAVYDSATPTLQVPALSNGLYQVAVAGVPGFNYAIEASTNLADWIRITTNASPYVFSDTNTVLWPQRFYRAVYIP